jgi:hypothetical protein
VAIGRYVDEGWHGAPPYDKASAWSAVKEQLLTMIATRLRTKVRDR